MLALLLIFEQAESIPTGLGLGPAGTMVTLLFLITLGVLNVIQFRKRAEVLTARKEAEAAKNETSHWQGTAAAYKEELVIVRERCQRIEDTSAGQAKEISVLRARTDLESLKSETSQVAKLLASEGKRAQEAHEAILHGLEGLAGAVTQMNDRAAERDNQYATLINSQSDLIKSLQSQMNLRTAMAVMENG